MHFSFGSFHSTLKASPEGRGFCVRSSSSPTNPVSEVCGIFSNMVLPSNSGLGAAKSNGSSQYCFGSILNPHDQQLEWKFPEAWHWNFYLMSMTIKCALPSCMTLHLKYTQAYPPHTCMCAHTVSQANTIMRFPMPFKNIFSVICLSFLFPPSVLLLFPTLPS